MGMVKAYTRNYARRDAENTDANPSEGVWARYNEGFDKIRMFEDFVNLGIGSTDDTNGWKYAIDTGCTVAAIDEFGGIIRLAIDGDGTNEAASIQSGGATGGAWKIDKDDKQQLWFEARWRVSQVTSDHGIAVGLGEAAVTLADVVADGCGALEDKDFVGFTVFDDDNDALDCYYKKDNETAVIHQSAADTLVASTWVKTGMWFDGIKLHYYINGDEVSAGGLAIGGSSGVHATFPENEPLSVIISHKTQGGTASNLDVDWVMVACERVKSS